MKVRYVELANNQTMYTEATEHLPREGETVVFRQVGKSVSEAFVEYTVQEVVRYPAAGRVFVICVKRRDVSRATARMHALMKGDL